MRVGTHSFFLLGLALGVTACGTNNGKSGAALDGGGSLTGGSGLSTSGGNANANAGGNSGGSTGATTGSTTGGTTGSSSGGTTGATSGGTTGATSGGTTGGTTGAACDASKAPTVPKMFLDPVITGLNRLVFAAQPPESSDWYLVEQGGKVLVLESGATTPRSMAFLTMSDIAVSNDDERGLLSLAFAPDYKTTGKLYVMVTPTSGSLANHDVVYEYTRSSADPFVADPNTPKLIVDIGQSDTNHNGGTVAFGKDGFLYVGAGDGGGACESSKGGKTQDISSLWGKMLRLDPKAAGPLYAAAGNPFASDGDARVFHLGLRNPFRFGFDRVTGDLFIGDVGQSDVEEINYVPAGVSGLNFGWPDYEGAKNNTCPFAGAIRNGATHTLPVFGADRTGNTTPKFKDYNSVIAGVVYRGQAISQLQGTYLFGDYKGQRLGALVQCGTATSPVTPLNKKCDANAPSEACLTVKGGGNALSDLWAIVSGNDNEIYLVGNRSTLFKVTPN